jgi:hypothetical protein
MGQRALQGVVALLIIGLVLFLCAAPAIAAEKVYCSTIGAILSFFGAGCPSAPDETNSQAQVGTGTWTMVINALGGAYFLCKPDCGSGDDLNYYDPNDYRSAPLPMFDMPTYFQELQANVAKKGPANAVDNVSFVETVYQLSNKAHAALPAGASNAAGYWNAYGTDKNGNPKVAGGWTEYPNDGQPGDGPLPGDVVVWTGGNGHVGIVVSVVDSNGKYVAASSTEPDPPTSGSAYIALADQPGNYITTQADIDPTKGIFPFPVGPGIHLLKVDFGGNGELASGISGETIAGFIRNSVLLAGGYTGRLTLGGSLPAELPSAMYCTDPANPGSSAAVSCVTVAEDFANQYHISPNAFVRQIYDESGFNPRAVSPAGAVGIAQFMAGTARSWGLTVTDSVDQRLDPTKALGAAANMMSHNYTDYLSKYSQYHISPDEAYTLAVAAYNCGNGCADAAYEQALSAYPCTRTGTCPHPPSWPSQYKYAWEQYLPNETKNYIKVILGS